MQIKFLIVFCACLAVALAKPTKSTANKLAVEPQIRPLSPNIMYVRLPLEKLNVDLLKRVRRQLSLGGNVSHAPGQGYNVGVGANAPLWSNSNSKLTGSAGYSQTFGSGVKSPPNYTAGLNFESSKGNSNWNANVGVSKTPGFKPSFNAGVGYTFGK